VPFRTRNLKGTPEYALPRAIMRARERMCVRDLRARAGVCVRACVCARARAPADTAAGHAKPEQALIPGPGPNVPAEHAPHAFAAPSAG
jgi:hypothetical protein